MLAPLQMLGLRSFRTNLFPNSTSYYNIFKFRTIVFTMIGRNPNLRPVFTQPVGPSATLSLIPYTASHVLNFDLDSRFRMGHLCSVSVIMALTISRLPASLRPAQSL